MLLIVGLLYAQAVFGLTFTHMLAERNANTWDGRIDYEPGHNLVISGMINWHDNGKQDRKFRFYYTSTSGMSCSAGSWTDYINSWDGELDFECPWGQAIAGVSSYHDDDKEDRRFRFKCCDITSGGRFKIFQTDTSGFMNRWDESLDAKCNSNSVLVGLWSYHDNVTEDRRWKLRCGSVDDRDDVPESPFVVLRNELLSGYVNGFQEGFQYSAPPNKAINGLRSWHADAKEDRTWRVRTVQMEGVTCSPGAWTAYQNEWDMLLDFTCPHNQVLAGFGSHYSNAKRDRRYFFSCCSVAESGYFVTGTYQTGWANEWDKWLNLQCGRGELMTGLYSYHDDGKEDRLFQLKCAQVKQNAPDYDDCVAVDIVDATVGEAHLACPKNFELADKDEGKCPGTGTCCTLFWSQSCDQSCAKSRCRSYGGLWIELDYSSNPYTCEMREHDAAKIVTVDKYTTDFPACGNSNVAELSTLTIEKTQQVSKTESFELTKSMEESFSFSRTKEFHMTVGAELTADLDSVSGSSELKLSAEMGWKTAITSEEGFTMGSSQNEKEEKTTVEVDVMSSEHEFKPEPYQWRRVRATYLLKTVSIPVKLHARCKRKDGKYKYKWIDSTFKNGDYSHITVEYLDKTDECPQSYYKKCECATGLLSEYNTVDGCSVHPFMSGHAGCYVYKKNGCGNGQGLGVATPRPGVDICDDPVRCPNARHYWDYPLDPTVWEWSYKACGGDQFYDDEPIDDMLTKLPLTSCYRTRLTTTRYETKYAAATACAAANQKSTDSCLGVYDPYCDNRNSFYLCGDGPLKASSSSCVYRMIDDRRREVAADHLLAPPPAFRRTNDMDTLDEGEDFDGGDLNDFAGDDLEEVLGGDEFSIDDHEP